MIDIGNIEAEGVWVGATKAVGLYQGDVEVWSKDTPPNPLTVVKYKAASGLDDWEDDIVGDLHGGVDMWHRPQPTAQIPNVLSADSVEIGTHVTSFGQFAFINCTNISEVTIPDSVLSIGSSAFSGCSGLTSVHITDIAKWCGISFGSPDANPLYYAHNLYCNGVKVTDLVVPDSVTSIGDETFSNCTGLTSITIGDGVTNIGTYAFSGCTGLTGVTIPDGVTSIGKNAFTNCTNLTSVTFVGKDMATVQGMSDYKWGLKTGCVLHCTDGDITI